MTAIILQARLDSSRLPGKALLPLGEKPMIFRVMEALNFIPADLRILACSVDSFSAFSPLAAEADFKIFAGPKDDVLERFSRVIRSFSIDRVIRATGDNPFVFADAAAALNAEAMAINADYSVYYGIPTGAGIESVSAAAMLRAGNEAVSSHDREHVCPYLYAHPELYNLHRPLAPLRWQSPDIRLTVDTQEDYDRSKELYAALKDKPQKHHGTVIIKIYKNIFTEAV